MSKEFEKVGYKDILCLEPTFISLDISVNGTGWVRSREGQIEKGVRELKSKDEMGRRKEFREFLLELLGEDHYPVVFVEDAIAGVNFKTVKILVQLNPIIDDLKEYGLVDVGEIKRVDNKQWKRYLKELTQYKSKIKCEDDKEMVRGCMRELGYTEKVAQDVYDALGLAIGVIYRDKVKGEKQTIGQPLKMDLKRGYTIKQYPTAGVLAMKAIKEGNKRKRSIEEIDWVGENRDILQLFKRKVKAEGVDDRVYMIKIHSKKLGVLALTKKLDTSNEVAYLMITKTK